MTIRLIGCLLAVLAMQFAASWAQAQEAQQFDAYGGYLKAKAKATGFFRVEQVGGTWWLITPDGNGLFAKGVCHVTVSGDDSPKLGYSPYNRAVMAKYGTVEKWADATAARLKGWGVNCVGAWSSPELRGRGLAYAVILDLAAKTTKDMWLKGKFPDVFDPEFAKAVDERASKMCGPLKDDKWLMGYFPDNELRWGPDWRGKETVLQLFLNMPADAPGRKRAEAFLKERGADAKAPSPADAEAFLELAASEYLRVTGEAIAKADPNHMNLGCRFAGKPPEAVIRAIKGKVAIVSLNHYDHKAPLRSIDRLHEVTGLPVMITEFSFKAMDSGLPNSKGGGKPVATQKDRADLLEDYVRTLAATKHVVGYQWFEYGDEPKEGRFDGEDCNYGLVKIDDSPWEELTARMTKVNAQVEAIRTGAVPTGAAPTTPGR